MGKEQRFHFSCFLLHFSSCIFVRSCYNRTCDGTKQRNHKMICPRSVVDSTRDSGSLSVGSNPAEGATRIGSIIFECGRVCGRFLFLGIPKKTIESEKILHEFCTAIWHDTAPPSRDQLDGTLFVPSHLKCASTFVKWLQYLYGPVFVKRI